MSGLLQTKVGEIADDDIVALIRELEEARPVGSHNFTDFPLLLFLEQHVYPQGPAKRIPINPALAAFTPLLETRVGKLPDGSLHDLCGELAALAGKALEFFNGNKVYVLLNKTLPKHSIVKAPGARQMRWDAVVQRRRSNR